MRFRHRRKVAISPHDTKQGTLFLAQPQLPIASGPGGRIAKAVREPTVIGDAKTKLAF